jgi:hypothetical protein
MEMSKTIPEFTAQHRFSRSHYFNLRKRGLGPREMRLGNRVIISEEAEADWVREREAEAARAETD